MGIAGQYAMDDIKTGKGGKGYRPNYFKHERCKARGGACSSCEPRPGQADCLAPAAGEEWPKWSDHLDLLVRSSKWKTFRSLYEMKCPEHIANMYLEVKVKGEEEYMKHWSVYVI